MAETAGLAFLADPLADPLVRRAAAEVVLIGLVGGTLGCWIVHYRLPYAAESVAHCTLPGLVLAALAGAPLVLGGALGLLAGVAAIGLASSVPAVSRDSAVAIAVTGLFGLGALLALSPSSPPAIGELLFGDVLAVSDADLALAGGLVALCLGTLALLHHRLLAVGFDRAAARAGGVHPQLVEAALLVLLALAVLVAVQGLGNLLAVSMLVGPAAVARLLTRRMSTMMALAAGVGLAGGLSGLLASYHLSIAAGASVAGVTVVLCLLALGAFRALRRAPSRPLPTPTI